jgi:transglutaminase/protease-like cytokinesis protein 3
MKKINVFLLLLISHQLLAQDYLKVDNIVKNYPNSYSSPDKLAKQIQDDFIMPEEKARAIYTWIALHVDYDLKLYKSGTKATTYSYSTEEEKQVKEREILEDLAKTTLKKKKGVCEGYATLFKILCDLVSIECQVVHGFAKTREQEIGIAPRGSNHAWNVVKINNEWKLVDATWGAGYVNWNTDKFVTEFSSCFFFMDPDKFVLNHFPDDEKWLFTKMSADKFAELPLYFTFFFEYGFKIIEPKEGIITPSRKDLVRIVLNNPNHYPVKVGLQNEKYVINVTPEIKNDEEVYEFEYDKKSGTYLTLYTNNKSIITYKLKSK